MLESMADRGWELLIFLCLPANFVFRNSFLLRGCLKKIDKVAFSLVLGIVFLFGSGNLMILNKI